MLQTPTRIHSSGMSWRVVLDVLLPQRGIPTFTKFNGAVELSRSWDDRLGRAIWSKIYRNGYELAAFNEWEFDVLKRLAQFKVPHTYRAVLLEREGTPAALAVVGRRSGPQITIKTENEGPTLADIVRMPTLSGGSVLAHHFADPRRYLRLVRSLISSLGAIHKNHFVHCDVHAGNIAIPVTDLHCSGDRGSPSEIKCELRVDRLKFIDFGFSIDRRSPPYTTLPFLRNGYGRKISQRFASLLEEVDRLGQEHLEAGKQWADAMFDPVFWRRIDPNPLHLLCQVDHREDIFQLGSMLADLRDGQGEFSDLGGCTVHAPPDSRIGQLVNTLPEALKTYSTSTVGNEGGQLTYLKWIDEIDRVLMGASTEVPSDDDILIFRQQFFGADSSTDTDQISQSFTQHVQKIQPRNVSAMQSAVGAVLKSDQPDRIKPLAQLTPESKDRDKEPIKARHSVVALYQDAAQPRAGGRAIAALLVVGSILLGMLVTYAISTKDAGVIYLPPSSSAGMTVAAYQPPTSSVPRRDYSIPQATPTPSPAQAELRAQKLAQVLGLAVVNEYYSGGRSIEVKLSDYEIGASPAYKLMVDISWRGSFLGQEGYQAKGVISVFSDGEMAPVLGRNANWNPSWISDQLSAWLAARGMGRQLLSRPQQQ